MSDNVRDWLPTRRPPLLPPFIALCLAAPLLVAGCGTEPLQDDHAVGEAESALSVESVSNVSSGSTKLNFDDNQSESVVSVNKDTNGNRVITVTYNDGSPPVSCTLFSCSEGDSKVDYTSTTRHVRYGASNLGWSYSTNDGSTWVKHNQIAPPSGWAVLWGDPAIATSPPGGTQTNVYITNLAVSDASFAAHSSTGDLTGFINGPFTTGVIDGACIARSTDGGKTFSIQQCVTDSGHFYDGGSVAVAADSGPIYAAWVDINSNQIDVWKSPSPGSSFVQLASPAISTSTHPRIRAYNGRLYVAAQSSVDNKIYLTFWDGSSWSTPKAATNTALRDPDISFSTHAVRTGPQFSFDIAANSEFTDLPPASCSTQSQCTSAACSGISTCLTGCVSGSCVLADQVRIVYTKADGSNRAMGAAACDVDLKLCFGSVPNWETVSHAGDQYNPVIARFQGIPLVTAGSWHVAYQSRASDPTGNTVTLRHGKMYMLANGDPVMLGQDVHSYESVCPDLRGGSAGYWGDYNGLTFLGVDANTLEHRWIATFTDSFDGCPTQWDFFSNHAHVGAAVVR